LLTRLPSSLMAYMLLVDVVHALHRGLAPNYSIREVGVALPSSRQQFRVVYNSLTHGYPLLQDLRSQEDSLMLLAALLSDILYMQRCRLSSHQPDSKLDRLANPYVPLSSDSEATRLQAEMTDALARWAKHFQRGAKPNVLALYHFVQLQLACPEIWRLPHLAEYGNDNLHQRNQNQMHHFDIPERAMDLSWLILDQCGKSSTSEPDRMSIWLPITLFMSALVIWHRLRSQMAIGQGHGALKMLTPFRNEIVRLPWPCCVSMSKTLGRLMEG
jgi:hypothetical protein